MAYANYALIVESGRRELSVALEFLFSWVLSYVKKHVEYESARPQAEIVAHHGFLGLFLQ